MRNRKLRVNGSVNGQVDGEVDGEVDEEAEDSFEMDNVHGKDEKGGNEDGERWKGSGVGQSKAMGPGRGRSRKEQNKVAVTLVRKRSMGTSKMSNRIVISSVPRVLSVLAPILEALLTTEVRGFVAIGGCCCR